MWFSTFFHVAALGVYTVGIGFLLFSLIHLPTVFLFMLAVFAIIFNLLSKSDDFWWFAFESKKR